MRLSRVTFEAWGHYDPRASLAFPAGPRDLHVLVGANEAGKSTLLAGLESLLFGLDRKGSHGHRHGANTLALSGEGSLGDGRGLAWARRAGRKGAWSGQVGTTEVEEDAFAALLGGVDRERWRALFGFSDTQLARAADGLKDVPLSRIVAGEVDPRVLRDALEKSSQELYNRRKTAKKAANLLADEVRQLRADAEAQATLPAAWRQLEADEARLRDALAQADAAVTTTAAAAERARRRLAAWEPLDAATTLRAELDALGAPADLPPGAGERHRERMGVRDARIQAVADWQARHDALVEERAGLAVPDDLLAKEAAIEEVLVGRDPWLQRRTRAASAAAAIQQEEAALAADLADLLGTADPAALDDVVADATARAEVADRAEACARTARDAEKAAEADRRARRDLAADEAALAQLPARQDVTALAGALQEEPDDADRRRALAAERVRATTAKEAEAVARRRLASAWPEGTAEPDAPPTVAAVEAARTRHARLEAAVAATRADTARAREERDRRELALRGDATIGEAPSRAGLVELRAKRDAAVEDARRVLLGGESPGAIAVAGLVERLRGLVKEADTYADHLFDDAGAVLTRERLRRELEAAEEQLAARKAEEDEATAERDAAARAWAQALTAAGLVALPPDALAAWLADHATWRTAREAAESAAARAAALDRDVTSFEARLRRALAELEAPTHDRGAAPLADTDAWGVVVARARRRIEDARRTDDRRRALTERVEEARRGAAASRAEGEATANAAAQAIARWEGTRARLGLPPGLPVQAAPERVQRLADAKRRAATLAQRRLTRAEDEREAAAWAERARAILAPAVALPATTAPERLCEQADTALRAGRAARERRAVIDRDLPHVQERLERARAELAAIEADIAATLGAVGAADDATYLALAARASRAAGLRSQIAEHLARVAALRDDDTPAPFDDAVRAEGRDGLVHRLAEAERLATEAREAHAAATRAHHDAEQALRRVDGTGRAALARQASEERRERLRTTVEEWLVQRVAIGVLDRAIRRFEEEREPAVLARTGELFRQLTGGRYVDVQADGQAHLLRAVRDGGEGVPGLVLEPRDLSDGTRQQLYLAARLAWAERHCAEAEPLPLVLDDALAAFDDTRARAAITVLAGIAEHTQVLLLTHHQHVVELARDVLPGLAPIEVTPAGGR